jgi:hypothetical protein
MHATIDVDRRTIKTKIVSKDMAWTDPGALKTDWEFS